MRQLSFFAFMVTLLAAAQSAAVSLPPAALMNPAEWVRPSSFAPQVAENVSDVDGLRAALADPAVTSIVLAAGTYRINHPDEATNTGQLVVDREVEIRAADGLMPYQVVIDATPYLGESTSRVMYVNPPSADDVIDLVGFTITGGYHASWGGGISQENGYLQLSDMILSANESDDGGAIDVWGSGAVLLVHNSVFIDNYADSNGGAINLVSAGGLATVQSVFQDNEAGATGGAIYASNAPLVIVAETVLTGNEAAWGGGLTAIVQNVWVISSEFSDNTVSMHDGAAIFLYRLTSPAVGSCTDDPTSIILNSTFTANTGGSTVFLLEGVTDVLFTTISGNDGDGLVSYQDDVTCARVGHTILSGNTGVDVGTIETDQPVHSLGYNLVGTMDTYVETSGSFDDSSSQVGETDPGLLPLDDNGGPTLTMNPSFSSLARNGGVPAEFWLDYLAAIGYLGTGLEDQFVVDQRGDGFPRPQLQYADIGAVERVPTVPSFAGVSPSQALVGQPAQLEAILATPEDEDPPTGTVTFTSGALSCSATLAGDPSTATCTITFPSAGTHTVNVEYSGSDDHPATTASHDVDVATQEASIITLALNPDPPVAGEPLILEFEVSSAGSPASGALTVQLDGDEIASSTLVAGRVDVDAGTLAAGDYEVSASFTSTDPTVTDSSNTFQITVPSDDPGEEPGDPEDPEDPPVQLTFAIGPASPADSELGSTSGATVIAQISASVPAGHDALDLQTITLDLGGNLPDDLPTGFGHANLGTLSLHLDANGNGILDSGEPELGNATVTAGGTLGITFDAPLGIAPDTTVQLLLMATPADFQASLLRAVTAGAWSALMLLGVVTTAGLGRRRRGAHAVLLAIVVAVVLTACGGGTTPPGDDDPVEFTVTVRLTGATATSDATGDSHTFTVNVALPPVTIVIEQ